MGTPFGKYTLARKLAEGGMAEVYLARQGGLEGFEKLVVVKRILPSLSGDQAFVKMFLNEARVAARLNHPNVVQIFDLGKAEELYYIAMEFVHGEDLRELIRVADEGHLRPPHGLVCRVIADTLAGLHYAHTRASPDGKPLGLVHRDVSPQNILVTYEGGVKLVDFGIAKATQATNEQTQAGLFKGKFAYMSPEQATGKPLDARTDVFAVGILLWELCTWHRLFKRPSDMATLIAVAEDVIPSARELDASVPPELDAIIMKALARPLDERYQTAQEMRADLELLLRNQRWEGDALALQGFMRELFSKKLSQQDADIRSAGLASLDDFLLRVEESTRISWMPAKSPNEKKTPSVGLPSAPPTPPAPNRPPPPRVGPPIPGAAANLPTLPGNMQAPPDLFSGKAPAGFAPGVPGPPPNVPRPAPAKDPSAPLEAVNTVINMSPYANGAPQADDRAKQANDFTNTPTLMSPNSPVVPVVPVVIGPRESDSTAKRPSFDPQPKNRRVLVIAIAAGVFLAITLIIVLWPSHHDVPLVLPVDDKVDKDPKPDEPQLKLKPKPKGEQTATLSITTDVTAIITVDGVAEPPSHSVTIKVKSGVPHVVLAQRAGHHTSKTVRVPALLPNENLQIKISVK